MNRELNRLRTRLTAWYVGVVAIVLLAFGAALFYVLTRQISARLDDSLARAADVVGRAVLAGDERSGPSGRRLVDLDELRIPDRDVYVFEGGGSLVYPDTAAGWIRELAAEARRRGDMLTQRELSESQTWRALARRLAPSGGQPNVVVVTADAVELDDQYGGLVLAFGIAAVVALVVVGLGGWLVARRSAEPVRDAFERMRNFMADAAHELRTPVAVMEGHAEVALRQPREPAEYVEILGAVHQEAARLGGILENLLTIARADAGAWPVHFETLFLDDLLLDVTENVNAVASGKQVNLEVTALDELPVRGDRDLLRQLLMIVLDNALKFSPDGDRVKVAARLRDGRAEVEVTDNGPGMSEEVLAHVFERFYRGDSAHRRAAGAGLGLSIAKWIADMHDATIAIDSRMGRGTHVVLNFPTHTKD